MKNITIIILLIISSNGFAQSQGSTNFSSNTLEGWENTDGSTNNLSLEPNPVFPENYYLRKICDGTNTTNGEMAIKNSTYFINVFEGTSGYLVVTIKNENNFNIFLRMGFADADGTKIISTNPIIIPPGDFVFPNFVSDSENYTVLEGPNTIQHVLENSTEMRLINNEEISFNGVFVNGIFDIDAIGIATLGIDNNETSLIKIYPNPANNILNLALQNTEIANVTLNDISGNLVLSKTLTGASNQLNIESLNSGVYLITIISQEGNKQTLKFIKE